MLIKRKSPFSGRENVRDIRVTREQLDLWQDGASIQTVMPHLSVDDREYLMTGVLPDEWEDTFSES